MSGRRDVALGLAAAALGIAYFFAARALPISLLSDAVGPGGVPGTVAVVMFLAGALLALRGVRAGRTATADVASSAHGRALGLMIMLVAYVALLPLLGYPVAIGLLAAAVATYAGARRLPSVLAFGVGTAAVLWLSFVGALGIGMPAGRLLGGT